MKAEQIGRHWEPEAKAEQIGRHWERTSDFHRFYFCEILGEVVDKLGLSIADGPIFLPLQFINGRLMRM